MNLKQALATLDTANDDHWTADGLPRVDVVCEAVKKDVTRRDITHAAPTFTRANASGGTPPPVGHPPAEPDPPAETTPAEEAPATEGEPAADPPAETPTEPSPEAAPEAPASPGTTPEEAPDAKPAPEEPKEPGDAQAAAHVEPHDDVVGMSVNEVMSDIDLVDRAITEFGRQAAVLTARREAVVAQLKDVGTRSAMLTRARNMLVRKGACPTKATPIQDYLARAQESRKARAMRARKFIEAGTSPAAVISELQGPSKIDAAMKSKRQRGAHRPVYPVKVGQ